MAIINKGSKNPVIDKSKSSFAKLVWDIMFVLFVFAESALLKGGGFNAWERYIKLGIEFGFFAISILLFFTLYGRNKPSLLLKQFFSLHSIWFLSFFVFSLLSLLWAQQRELSITIIKYLLRPLLLAIIIPLRVRDSSDYKKVVFSVVVAAILVVIFTLIQTTFPMTKRLGINAGLNPNSLGILASISFLLVLYLGVSHRSIIITLASLLFVVLSLLTGSKKALLMILIGLGGFFFFRYSGKKRLYVLASMLIIAFSIYFAMMYYKPLHAVIGYRIRDMLDSLRYRTGDNNSTIERLSFIKSGWDLFKQKPLLGFGLGQYAAQQANYGLRETYSHINYLEIASTLGCIGIVLYYWHPIKMLFLKREQAIGNNEFSLAQTLLVAIFLLDMAVVSYYDILIHVCLGLAFTAFRTTTNGDTSRMQRSNTKPKFVKRLIIKAMKMGLFNHMPDEYYLRLKFKVLMGSKLNLKNPQSFNEKIQWSKLFDRRPEYTMMVDKYKVRNYVESIIGADHLIPILGVWKNPKDIDFDSLPNQFVLKCNHNSGLGMFICKDKSKLDIEKVKKNLRKGLKQDYYLAGREWPYKNVPRKIIAEEYMVDESGTELKDYKFNCFNGEPVFVQVMSGRSKGKYCLDHFGLEWQQMDIRRKNHLPSDVPIQRPEHLDEMIQIARILSKDIPYVRIDLYQAQGRVFFGEITFFPLSGYVDYVDYQTDLELGRMIQLPNKVKES